MWPFSRHPKAWLPPVNTGPTSFADWTDDEIARMSAALRIHGQPDSDGWRRQARIVLNAMRGGGAIEQVARVIEMTVNDGRNPDRAILGGHYMHGMPAWCGWVEQARPAVAEMITGWRSRSGGL